MTAETVESSFPDWARPPTRGFAAEDLDRIAELPPHTELIDGSLVFVSPQRYFNQAVTHRLRNAMDDLVPADHEVLSHMTVKLAPRQRPEPDLIVVGPNAPKRPDVACFDATDVILAVEVVSPDSAARDRQRKPFLYAEAGIPHHWRIEESNGRPAVFVYELDPATESYVATNIYRDRLRLSVPFDIDIDLTTLYQPR